MSVDIADIKVIRVVKKSKVAKGALSGLLILGGSGVLATGLAASVPGTLGKGDLSDIVKAVGILSAYGALIGAIIGALSKGSKKIQIERMSDAEIQKTLDKLRKKARIRDYK
ncbi:MAG: hypothetical protein GTN73_03705 [Candidatus Aminicenantes bacterium]|nr:hypothetical protein [Candidatus Aminicenantes bacterium]